METEKKVPTRAEFDAAYDIVSRYLWAKYYRAAELMDAAYKRGDQRRGEVLQEMTNESMVELFKMKRAVQYVKNLNI